MRYVVGLLIVVALGAFFAINCGEGGRGVGGAGGAAGSGGDGGAGGGVVEPLLELRELDTNDHGQLVIPDGFHAFGSYSSVPASARLAARELNPGALASPQDYVRACALTDCWKPVPTPGYVCLGLIEAAQKPLLDDVRCVRADLTTTGSLGALLPASSVSRHVIPTGPEGIQVGTYTNAWESLAEAGPFPNAGGWDKPQYAFTIQTADLDGDGQDELLARAGNGMVIHRFDSSSATWELLGSGGPFGDAGGWDQEQHYLTIQTADLDGDGQDELLGRGWNGMQVHRFDSTSGTWEVLALEGPFPDSTGFGQPQFYNTIQTADLDGDGQDELLGRSSTGMQVHRFDSDSATWEMLAGQGPFRDSGGWDQPQHYFTIQTADLDGDGQDELLGRGSSGMQVHRFDSTSGTWEILTDEGPFPNVDGGYPQFYRTIQTADVDGDGRDELLGRGGADMQVHRFDSSSATWEMLSGAGPYPKPGNWDEPEHYLTTQTADVDGDGRDDLLVRGSSGVVTYSYNADSHSWQGVAYGPPFNSPTFDTADHFLTLQTADVDGDGTCDLLMRGDTGMLAYRFVATSASWSGRALPPPVLDARWVQVPEPLTADAVEELIRDQGPVMYFHPDEDYFPDDPEWALDNGIKLAWGLVENEWGEPEDFRILNQNDMETSAATLMDDVDQLLTEVWPNPPYNREASFRYWLEIPDAILLGDLNRATAVVRVIPWNHFSTEIQFWLFYPFNGPGRLQAPAGSQQLSYAGLHYGDWEHVTLRFRNRTGELEAVYMSAHAGGYWFGLSDFGVGLQFEDAHPLVYSAKYSHAHYAREGTHFYKTVFEYEGFSYVLFDLAGQDQSIPWHDPGRYRYISHEDDLALPADWLAFEGRWGQYQPLWDEIVPGIYTWEEISRGPTGPNIKTPWKIGSSGAALGYQDAE